MPSIFEEIGENILADILDEFYERCFQDPMLAHFFWGLNHKELVAKQLAFTITLLGGPTGYQGKGLVHAHSPFQIRPPHFYRRQKILAETIERAGLPSHIRESWLEKEEKLKHLILSSSDGCHH